MTRSAWVRGALALSIAVLGSGVAAQQKGPAKPAAPANPLAAAQSLQCSFTTYAVTGWKDGKAQTVTSDEVFGFQIIVLNLKKSRGRIVGQSAAEDATVVLTQTGLTAIEQTPIGNFLVTTVFTTGGADGRFLAIHSRHIGDPTSDPSPSQHYGSCRIVN